MSSSTRRPTDAAAGGAPRRGRAPERDAVISGSKDRGGAERAGIVAFLGAFCLVLSLLEYMIPKPLPFMRLGIANLPILIGAAFLDLPALLALVLVKAIGMSLVSGTLFSYIALFSLAGSAAAALSMWIVLRAPRGLVSSIGASIIGAIASNVTQLALARLIVFREAAILVAPPFLAAGLIAGLALGVFAELFREKSAWLAEIGAAPTLGRPARLSGGLDAARNGLAGAAYPPGKSPGAASLDQRRSALREKWDAALPPKAAALIGLAACLGFLSLDILPLRAAMAATFLGLALLSGARVSILATVLTAVGIVSANLLVPVGRVIAELGPLRIAETALLEGIDKALLFEGLLFASKAFVRRGLRLPGRLGSALASAFETFDAIIERGRGLRLATFVEDADALALEAWRNRPEREAPD